MQAQSIDKISIILYYALIAKFRKNKNKEGISVSESFYQRLGFRLHQFAEEQGLTQEELQAAEEARVLKDKEESQGLFRDEEGTLHRMTRI
jgi:hypothetical protein